MTRNSALIVLTLIIAGTAAIPSAMAQKPPATTAEEVRDRAISKLVAWRPKSAENILHKAPEFDKSQPYLTAEAFLMATYSLEKDPGTVERARKILEKQVEKDPRDPVAQFYLGEVYQWMGIKEKAKAAWQKSHDKAKAIVDENPKDATARFYLGASLVRLGKAEPARKMLKKAAKDGFDKPMVDFQIGLTFMIQKNWKAARNSFDAVHELDPRYAHLYFFRGLAWDKLGRKDNLFNDLSQFVKLAPNSPEASKAKAILSAAR